MLIKVWDSIDPDSVFMEHMFFYHHWKLSSSVGKGRREGVGTEVQGMNHAPFTMPFQTPLTFLCCCLESELRKKFGE